MVPFWREAVGVGGWVHGAPRASRPTVMESDGSVLWGGGLPPPLYHPEFSSPSRRRGYNELLSVPLLSAVAAQEEPRVAWNQEPTARTHGLDLKTFLESPRGRCPPVAGVHRRPSRRRERLFLGKRWSFGNRFTDPKPRHRKRTPR